MERRDNWTRFGDPWSVRREAEAVDVVFAGQTEEPSHMICRSSVTAADRSTRSASGRAKRPSISISLSLTIRNTIFAVREKNRAEDISRVLYPNDSSDGGKRLRIRQQYFFCSASVQDIVGKHVAQHGPDFGDFASLYAVQLNDTHHGRDCGADPNLNGRLRDVFRRIFCRREKDVQLHKSYRYGRSAGKMGLTAL